MSARILSRRTAKRAALKQLRKSKRLFLQPVNPEIQFIIDRMVATIGFCLADPGPALSTLLARPDVRCFFHAATVASMYVSRSAASVSATCREHSVIWAMTSEVVACWASTARSVRR